MWSALFGYLGPVSTSLVERAALLLCVGPWLILLEASAAPSRGWGKTLVRFVLVLFLLDRLVEDFAFWLLPALIVGAAWPVVEDRWRPTDTPAASHVRAGAWLIAGTVLGVGAAYLGRFTSWQFAVVLYIVVGLYASGWWRGVRSADPQPSRQDGPAAGRPSPALDAAGPTDCIAGVILYGLASAILLLALGGLERHTLPGLLLVGITGWIGVQFFCWRGWRHRSAGALRGLLRGASVSAGATASLLAAVLVAEFYFRHVYDASDANGELRTALAWFRRHVQCNSWGYRDREIPSPDELNKLTRIVLLGDSFVFGWGLNNYDDLIGPRLERALAAKVLPPPRVFSLGVPGINTRDQIKIFKDQAVRLHPRVVVLAYVLNDIEGIEKLPPPRVRPWLGWQPITDSSDFLEFAIWHLALRRHQSKLQIIDLPGLRDYQNPALLARQAEDLGTLFRLIREAGARPVVVLYPYLGVPADSEPLRYAMEQVRAIVRANDVPLVDLSVLVDAMDPRMQVNRFDPHPSPALHEATIPFVAEAVLAELREPPASLPASAPSR